MIAGQVVRGARDRDPGVQHAQLELPQPLVAAGVRMRDQGAHGDASFHGSFESLFDGFEVEPENHDVDGLACALDGGKDGLVPSRLRDEFH